MKKENKVKRMKKTFWKRFTDYFRNLDLYGKNINLTYEGNEKFKTHIGALISFCILMFILSYVGLQLRVMFLKNNTTFAKNSLQKDLTNDSEVHSIGEGNIQFGMNIDYNGVNLLSDSSYFTYTLKQVSQQYVLQGSKYVSKRIKTNLPVSYCTLDSFYQLSQDLYDRLTIKEYYCPTVKNYTIVANYNAPRYDYIEIKLYRCNPRNSKVTCKTDISDVMKQTQFTLIVANNYIDFDNYVQPVQNYLDDRFFWDLAPGLRKKVDIFVRKNGANFIDDYVQLGQSTDNSFYQVYSMRESIVIEETDLQIVSIYFRLDSNYDNYSRRVYSFGDLLGQSGGLYSAIFMLGGVIISIFSERLFVSSILHKIYQIDEIRDNEVKKSIAESKGKNIVLPQNQVSFYGKICYF